MFHIMTAWCPNSSAGETFTYMSYEPPICPICDVCARCQYPGVEHDDSGSCPRDTDTQGKQIGEI